MQGEVRASTSKSHIRVVLQLQVGRGSTDASQRDLETANAELNDTYNDHKQIGQLKFLALHAQGATIYLTSRPRSNDPPDTPPTVDPAWDLGWMIPHPEREIPTIAKKKYDKNMQQMDEAWKSTFNRSGKCHHCSRTAGPNTNTTSPSYPSTDTCPLHNLLIEMLDRSGLGKIAYLFDRIHTLSELSNLLGSDLDCNDHLVLRIITGGCTIIAYVEVAHCCCFSL
jgi:hypothetical protein